MTPLAQRRPSVLLRGRWPFSRNALRSDGASLEAWHKNCPYMKRSRKNPLPSRTGVAHTQRRSIYPFGGNMRICARAPCAL